MCTMHVQLFLIYLKLYIKPEDLETDIITEYVLFIKWTNTTDTCGSNGSLLTIHSRVIHHVRFI